MHYGNLFLKPRIKQLSGRRRNWAKNNGIILTGFNLKNASECSKYMKILKRILVAGNPSMPKRMVDRIVQLHRLFQHRIVQELCLPFDARTFPLERTGASNCFEALGAVDIFSNIRFSWVRQDERIRFSFSDFSRLLSSSCSISNAMSCRIRSRPVYCSYTSGFRMLRLVPSASIAYFALNFLKIASH